MKHYILNIVTHYGEYEQGSKVISNSVSKDNLRYIAMNERGSQEEEYDAEMKGYWFDGCFVSLPTIEKELTAAEYKSLIKLDVLYEFKFNH